MSSVVPIQVSGAAVDLSTRYAGSTAVVTSPALAAETIIASVTIPNNIQVASGVRLYGWAAFTVGTGGVSATLKLRQTSTSGATVVSSGALTVVATDLYAIPIMGFDTAPAQGQVYKLTLTIGSGAAASTVSAVLLDATPI